MRQRDVAYWHFSDVADLANYVRSWGQADLAVTSDDFRN